MKFSKLLVVMISATALTASCRHTDESTGGSEVNEATSKGFKYENMSIDLVDRDGHPVPGVPVHFSSSHWIYQVAHLPSDVPIFIPIIDPKWVPKEDHRGILGYTDMGGHFESGAFSVKSHGVLPGTGPAKFTLEAKGWFPAKCSGNESGLVLDANVGKLAVLDAQPKASVKQGFDCSLEIDAKTDDNKTLYLRCQSSLAAAEVAQNIQAAKQNCTP